MLDSFVVNTSKLASPIFLYYLYILYVYFIYIYLNYDQLGNQPIGVFTENGRCQDGFPSSIFQFESGAADLSSFSYRLVDNSYAFTEQSRLSYYIRIKHV